MVGQHYSERNDSSFTFDSKSTLENSPIGRIKDREMGKE
jgi:hypothetical protein